jgi:chemotaxis protein methyltransferase CheR
MLGFERNNIPDGFVLTDSLYDRLSRLIYDTAGINLGDNKKELLHARLSKLVRRKNLRGFADYVRILSEDKSGEELICLLDAISTNVTHFFREDQHFRFLTSHVRDRGHAGGLRIWSAACSSGEEPYSLAITLMESILKPCSPHPYILASDISTKVLRRAADGIYPLKAVEHLDASLVRRYFQKGTNMSEGLVKVKREIRSMVDFERVNLMEPFPFSPGFDVIFCRNVMIYFDTATREATVNKMYQLLNPLGYLIIGHSENLNGLHHSFTYVQPSIYRK